MNRSETLNMTPDTGGERGPHLPTLIGGTLLAVIFIAAFVVALQWSREAAIFPLAVSGFGAVLGIGIVGRALLWRRLGTAPSNEDAQDGTDNVFASISRRDLLMSIACFSGFFLALYVLGLYVAAPLFTLLYLRVQAAKPWIFSVLYSGVLVSILYVLFDLFMNQPVPSGLF